MDDHDLLDIEDGDDYGEEIDYKREEELLQDEDLEEDEEEQSTQPDLILHNEEEIDEEEGMYAIRIVLKTLTFNKDHIYTAKIAYKN